jgi:hypothetical protein
MNIVRSILWFAMPSFLFITASYILTFTNDISEVCFFVGMDSDRE